MPPRVLDTYRSFLEGLTVYNTVAGGLGEAYTSPTSIPQGDPFSMMIVAIILRAWIMQMKSLGVQPRLLAGDLHLLSIGTRHPEHVVHAFDKTHEYMEDMAAKIAPQTCYACSTNTTAREWLRSHRWRRIQRTIPVVNAMRDLGAHWCLGGRQVASTLTRRMLDTTNSLEGLDKFKAPFEKKVATIRATLIPKRALWM